jgi:hypothetical protein
LEVVGTDEAEIDGVDAGRADRTVQIILSLAPHANQ